MRAIQLAGYAAPALPLAALYFPVFVYLAPFYAAERGVGLAELGALFIAVRLVDAFSDPLMGWVSDRVRTPWGRRRVWLAVSVPLVCLSSWMLFAPPADAGFGHVVLWLTALTLSWTIALTPYFAWGAEMSGDYATRARVTSWREASSLIGTVIAVVIYNTASGSEAGLVGVALMVCIGFPLATIAALSFTGEPQDHSRERQPILPALRAISANRYFRRLLAAYFVNGLANALPAGLFLFFIEDLLGAPDAGWLLLLYFVAAIGAMPLWSWAAKRLSKHRAWGWAMIYASVLFAPAVFLGEGDVMLFTAITLLTGLALGADLSLPSAIQADVVDHDTATSGEQRTGVFFALWSVATKAALAIAGGTALIALDVSGFVSKGDNSETALWTLAALYALAPAVLKLIAVALMWNFPLGEEEQRLLRIEIESSISRQ